MDQVVNLFIEREHGLIKALSTRTPVVETYLQNLTADPQLGPVPSEDHYFLGRLDMGESIDRKDYLKEEEKSMQSRLLGGFQKLYKVQYQPMGFSWMVYVAMIDGKVPSSLRMSSRRRSWALSSRCNRSNAGVIRWPVRNAVTRRTDSQIASIAPATPALTRTFSSQI